MGASKAQRAKAAEKRAKAVAMRLAGADWNSIAKAVGYASPGAACTAVDEALKANLRQQHDKTEELRQLAVMRYDRLQAAFWPKALKGDPKAADVVLKCLAGRERVEGTAAPTKMEHGGSVVTYQVEGVDLDQLR